MSKFLVVVIMFVTFGLSACSVPGDAIESMSSEQKSYLESNVLKIEQDMTEAEVSNLLGPVYRGSGTGRPVWLGPSGNKSSQIAVYYIDGKIDKVRWQYLGKFMWEHDFSSP